MELGVIAQRLGLPLTDALNAAARTGVAGVQLYSVSRYENLLDDSPRERRQVVGRCKDLGLKIFSICGEVGGFGFREKGRNPEAIDRTIRNLDLALELGCRIVTSHIGVVQTRPDSPFRRNQLDALREIGEYARRNDAVFAIETGPEPGVVLRDFLLELDAPGIAVNLDPGNMVMITGENPAETAAALAPWIIHTHVKDGRRYRACDPETVYAAFATGGIERLIAETGTLFAEMRAGDGDVPWPEYLNALRENGFNGPLVIEREVSKESFGEVCRSVQYLAPLIKGNDHVQLQ